MPSPIVVVQRRLQRCIRDGVQVQEDVPEDGCERRPVGDGRPVANERGLEVGRQPAEVVDEGRRTRALCDDDLRQAL